MEEGKTLPKVLSAFADVLHKEIEDYYQAERTIKKAREGGEPLRSRIYTFCCDSDSHCPRGEGNKV